MRAGMDIDYQRIIGRTGRTFLLCYPEFCSSVTLSVFPKIRLGKILKFFNFTKIDIQIVIFSKIMYICSRRPQYRSPVGVRVAGCGHFRKRLSALILDCLKFSQNLKQWSRIEQR